MELRNPGAGGAAGTVTTDGTTITGNGTVATPIALLDAITDGVTLQGAGISASKLALKAVQTAAQLTGAGTVASPLGISGWPMSGFNRAGYLAAVYNNTSPNALALSPFNLPYALTFANIAVYVSTPDASHNSDIGLFNSAGTLVANIGAQLISSSGEQAFATAQGSQTIPPGLYWFALTSAATSFSIYGDNTSMSLYFSQAFGSSVGGALPASISPPAFSIARNLLSFMLY